MTRNSMSLWTTYMNNEDVDAEEQGVLKVQDTLKTQGIVNSHDNQEFKIRDSSTESSHIGIKHTHVIH